MIATGWRPTVACPHEAVECIVTERLVLRQRAAALGGYYGRETQHVAIIVIGARLTPQRLSPFGEAVTEGPPNVVVLRGQTE